MSRFQLNPKFNRENWTRFWPHLKMSGQKQPNPHLLDELAYQRGYWDLSFFAQYFFSHHCKFPFSKMHLDFCRAEADPAQRGRREAIAAPRANAKTTFKLLIKAIHAIVYGYESYILIIGHSAPEAVEKVQSIQEELEGNQRLIRVYGPLAPLRGKNPGKGRWGKKKFMTQNGVLVVAKSKGQQIRGTKNQADRPSLIICDDVESPSEVLSPEQRLKARDWFFKDVAKCGQVDGSTNIVVIGTVLHSESLLAELLQSPGYQSSRYQAIISFAHRQDLWKHWQGVYTELSNPRRHTDAKAFYEANKATMLEGTEVLWPEGEPYEYLIRLRVDEGIASFQSEKQNDPYDPERQLLDMQHARRFRVSYSDGEFYAIHWLDGSNKTILRRDLETVVAFHDPAFGKKPGQLSEPDYAAIVVVAKDRDGYLYCLAAYLAKVSPSQQITQAFKMHETWGFDRLYFEDNGAQSLLEWMYREENNKRENEHIRVRGVTQTENKIQRITATLEPEITNGYLLFSEELSPLFLSQLRDFPTTHDDGPDALQGVVSQLKKRRDNIRNAPD